MAQTRFFALQGGMDIVTPSIRTAAGRAIAGMNYEPHPRGYQRADGYERFDGRPRPSLASYWTLAFTDGPAAAAVGSSVVGQSSGASATVLRDSVVDDGSYETEDASGYLIITGLTGGNFLEGEPLLAGSDGDPAAIDLSEYWSSPYEIDFYTLDFMEASAAELPAGWTFDTETGVLTVDPSAEASIEGLRMTATDVNGTVSSFSPHINIYVEAMAAAFIGNAAWSAIERGALNDEDDRTWYREAVALARSRIMRVPGSGPVRGVWMFHGEEYAFRDNEAGTACVMHRATADGWAAVAFGRELAFSGGSAEWPEGATLVGGTSGALATVRRVTLESGDWTTDDAAGRLIVTAISGEFVLGEAVTGGGGLAMADGPSVAISLPPGGRYDFRNHNFYGAANMRRMYGVNGVGRGFEFDGTVMVPIATGMEDDRPLWIDVHSGHLFFGYRGGSVQHSSLGNPYQWQILTGAGEIGIGEEPTGLLGSVSGTLSVFGRNKVAVLFGDDAENWVLRTLTDSSGAVAWTAQMLGTPIYHDAIGLRALETSDRFGDFAVGTLTQMVEPLFQQKARDRVTPVASIRVRPKDQYRLYWSDGTGIYVYIGRGAPEIMPFKLGFVPTCTAAGKDDDGEERLFAGDADGWVYELDAGTSADGEPIEAFVRFPFNHVGSPAQRKRWSKAVLELDASPDTNIGLISEFGYADPDQPPGQEQAFNVQGGGGFWNELRWDEFYWSSPVEGRAEADLDGLGRNLSIVVASNAAHEKPHILTGMILYFHYRGLAR